MTRSALLRNILNEVRDEKIITPVVRASLSSGDFQAFTVKVHEWNSRPPDGWFHPSEHGTWTVRQLVYYLAHWQELEAEKPTAEFVLAVTQGHFWHEFIQRLLLQKRVLESDEVPLVDEERNRRGHTDGAMTNDELLEIKTASTWAFKRFSTLADLKKNKPEYYAQTQDYLDMSGREVMRYFVMCMEYPYPMHEYLVPADQEFQFAQRRRYEEAIRAHREGIEIDPCCNQGSALSQSCPVAAVCPRGAVTL